MALLMVGMMFVACGKTISGTYSAEGYGTGMSYEFSGKKVTISVKVVGAEAAAIEGTYKIEGDKITLTFDGDEGKEHSGTFDFEEGDDFIKIGIVKYTKK